MKNFDNWTHKRQCNHNFYTQAYFYLRQSIHTFLDKSCSKWDLLVVIFIHYKMIDLDSITNENNKKHNEKWLYIPDHLHRILIIGGSGSRKTNTLLNLI